MSFEYPFDRFCHEKNILFGNEIFEFDTHAWTAPQTTGSVNGKTLLSVLDVSEKAQVCYRGIGAIFCTAGENDLVLTRKVKRATALQEIFHHGYRVP